jgi:hypothetical protein
MKHGLSARAGRRNASVLSRVRSAATNAPCVLVLPSPIAPSQRVVIPNDLYRPVKSGSRFSAKARMPSFWSSVAKSAANRIAS